MAAEEDSLDELFYLMLQVGREEDFRTELKNAPTLIDATNQFGMTLLHWAVRNGNIEIIKILIEHGADPSFPIGLNGNKTALHLAAQNSYFFAIYLTQLINQLTGKDFTPLLTQVLHQELNERMSILNTSLQQITNQLKSNDLMPLLAQVLQQELKESISLLKKNLQQIKKLEEKLQLLMYLLQENLLQEFEPTLVQVLTRSNPENFSPLFKPILTYVQTNLSHIRTTPELMAILEHTNDPMDFALLLGQMEKVHSTVSAQSKLDF